MPGLTVVLDRKEMLVTTDAGAIKIECPGRKIERVPIKMIDSVIVIGSPMVACGVWRLLANENVPAVLIPVRGKGKSVYIGSGLSATGYKRKLQYKAILNPETKISAARYVVRVKLEKQRTVLSKLMKTNSKKKKQVEKKFNKHIALLDCVHQYDKFMGIEGAAAAFYFKEFSNFFSKKWGFQIRNKRPPKDPVNALLSLSYVLAGSEIRREVLASGLDPVAGFLHSLKSGRDSLVLDFLEPLRPDIDMFVLALIREKYLTLRSFSNNSQDGCRLTKHGRSVYYKAWTEWKNRKENIRTICNNVQSMTNAMIDHCTKQ